MRGMDFEELLQLADERRAERLSKLPNFVEHPAEAELRNRISFPPRSSGYQRGARKSQRKNDGSAKKSMTPSCPMTVGESAKRMM